MMLTSSLNELGSGQGIFGFVVNLNRDVRYLSHREVRTQTETIGFAQSGQRPY